MSTNTILLEQKKRELISDLKKNYRHIVETRVTQSPTPFSFKSFNSSKSKIILFLRSDYVKYRFLNLTLHHTRLIYYIGFCAKFLRNPHDSVVKGVSIQRSVALSTHA